MILFVEVHVVFFLIFCSKLILSSGISTVSPNPISKLGYSKNISIVDGLTKRELQAKNLSRKNYDPPPEYYRGPASSSTPSTYNSVRDNSVAEYSTRAITFPQENYSFKGSNGGSWSNNAQQERKEHYDKISVEHFGTGSSNTGYGEEKNHGYVAKSANPYGPAQTIEYEYYVPTENSHSYSQGHDGIPVELYNRGYGGYGHAGEYATYAAHPPHHQGQLEGGHIAVGHLNGKHNYDKALLAKSFLIPLASAAVLGIAAALASNPLLLQLGTVSSVGKRKKRDLRENIAMHSRAYRSQKRN